MKVNPLILFVLVLVFGCSTGSNNDNKPVITASILPQKYLLQKIAGNRYEINIMIPPGSSPVTYDPAPKQLQELIESKAYFMMGNLGFENAWIKKMSSINESMPVFNLSSGIELIHSEHNHNNKHKKGINADPHIWLSPKGIKIISYNIYKALKEIIPSDSLFYKNNYYSFLEEIDSIDAEIGTSLSELDNRTFFIYHPALTYFARDYGLQQISVEQDGKLPSPFHLKQLINLAEKENIRIILIQEQFDVENAEILAHEIGARIIKINPLEEDLLSQLTYITSQLQKYLSDTLN